MFCQVKQGARPGVGLTRQLKGRICRPTGDRARRGDSGSPDDDRGRRHKPSPLLMATETLLCPLPHRLGSPRPPAERRRVRTAHPFTLPAPRSASHRPPLRSPARCDSPTRRGRQRQEVTRASPASPVGTRQCAACRGIRSGPSCAFSAFFFFFKCEVQMLEASRLRGGGENVWTARWEALGVSRLTFPPLLGTP